MPESANFSTGAYRPKSKARAVSHGSLRRMIRAATQQESPVGRKDQCMDKEEVFSKLATLFSTLRPQSDCVIVYPPPALDGSATASRDGTAIGRVCNAEYPYFMTAKATLAIARRQTPDDGITVKKLCSMRTRHSL